MPRPGEGHMGLAKHRKSGTPRVNGKTTVRRMIESNRELDAKNSIRERQKPPMKGSVKELFHP